MGAEEIVINKVTEALRNAENLSKVQLQRVYREALTFGEKLPQRERGAFLWRSNLEMLSMIIDGMEADK